MTDNAGRLMVALRLDLEDAVQVQWLDGESKPGKPWKARLVLVTLPDGALLAVDSTNITEACAPVRGIDGRYQVFFVGYWYLEADDPNRAHVAGMKDIAVEYEWEFYDPTTGARAVVGTHFEVTAPQRKAALTAMG